MCQKHCLWYTVHGQRLQASYQSAVTWCSITLEMSALSTWYEYWHCAVVRLNSPVCRRCWNSHLANWEAPSRCGGLAWHGQSWLALLFRTKHEGTSTTAIDPAEQGWSSNGFRKSMCRFSFCCIHAIWFSGLQIKAETYTIHIFVCAFFLLCHSTFLMLEFKLQLSLCI